MRIDILENKNIPNLEMLLNNLQFYSWVNNNNKDTYIVCSNITLEYLKYPHLELIKDDYKPLVTRWNGYKVLIDNELPEGIVDIR